jgi:hypothetical protein
MMHVGDDVTEASNRVIKRTKKVYDVTDHTENQFQKYLVPGRNVVTD